MTNRKLTALVSLGSALCVASAALAVASPIASARAGQVAVSTLTLAALFAVGLYAWRRHGDGRFGQVLYATGICWFFVSLGNSDISFFYSVGRIAGWVFEVVLAYALLSFPTGRLKPGPARFLVLAAAVMVVILYLPTIPLTDQYQVPVPFTSCTAHCPDNYFLAGSEPGFVVVIERLRDALAALLYLGGILVLATRLRRAGRNQRRTVAPVLAAALLSFAASIAYLVLRRVGTGEGGADTAIMVALASVPATALGFLLGLVQWRVYSASALGRLTTGLPEAESPRQLRDLLERSLEDRTADLLYAEPTPRGNGVPPPWHDSSEAIVMAPVARPRTCLHEAEAESGLRVAVVCEESFRDHPDFLESVSACLISGLERQRLDAALADSLADVAASRKRLVGAADSARQKIERDLHDGAQQQLVALRIKLELAREAFERDSAEGAQLAGLGSEVEEIIEEVRSLARGIYPSLLASDGLEEALRAAGRRSPIPVTVVADGVGRLPTEIESAAYFCCLEALQNVSKHADGATAVQITLAADHEVRFELTDDGCGFEDMTPKQGSGMVGMRDRLAAVGGELSVESAPGAGTRVAGRIPLG